MQTGARFDGTPAEHFDAWIECVEDGGHVVVVGDSGSGPVFYVDAPAGSEVAADAAVAQCLEELGEPGTGQPLTDAQLQVLYDHGLDTRDCLLDLGYPVDPPSTFAEFRTDYNGGTAWSPYRQVSELVAGVDPHAWAEINDLCPQSPAEAAEW